MTSSGDSPVGRVGRISRLGAIRPGRLGEVLLPIRGGLEACLARDVDGEAIEAEVELGAEADAKRVELGATADAKRVELAASADAKRAGALEKQSDAVIGAATDQPASNGATPAGPPEKTVD